MSTYHVTKVGTGHAILTQISVRSMSESWNISTASINFAKEIPRFSVGVAYVATRFVSAVLIAPLRIFNTSTAAELHFPPTWSIQCGSCSESEWHSVLHSSNQEAGMQKQRKGGRSFSLHVLDDKSRKIPFIYFSWLSSAVLRNNKLIRDLFDFAP